MTALARADRLRRAQALLRAGDLDGAETIARSLLAERAADDEALALMGRVTSGRTQYDLAADWFAKAIRAERRQPMHHCRLGDANIRRGKLREAMVNYEQALKLQPDLAAALIGKANVLLRRGKAGRARALLEPALRGGRASATMVALHARILHQLDEHEAVRALAETHLPAASMIGGARRALLLVLGASLDRLRRHDEAFAAIAEGNAIGAPPFDATHVERRVDEIIATFGPGRDAALPRSTVDDALAVFVIGMPRCGSTLVEQIIHAHPSAHGAGEIHDLAHLARMLPAAIGAEEPAPGCLARMSVQQVNEAARSLLARLRAYAPRAERVVDKSLENHEHVGLIRHLLPAARIIHVRRDPLDVCLSCFMSDLAPTLHPYASRLEDLGRYYRQYDRLMAFWRNLAGEAMLEVRYEDVVAKLEANARNIIEFIGLPWDDRCLRFHEAARDVSTLSADQVRRPIYHSAVARHRRYEAHLGPLRDALGDVLAEDDEDHGGSPTP